MRVFLSWSKRPSEDYAKLVREFLPQIINIKQDDIFMSSESIGLGTNGILSINENLSESGFGLLFMTPNNKDETWLNFEAGAISKGLTGNRVTPIVFDTKDKDSVLSGGPISTLQGTLFSEESFLKIILDMNKELPEDLRREEELVKKIYLNLWKGIERQVSGISGGGNKGKSWYSDEESNPDPIEIKINRIHDILENRVISAQESINQNQVVNWSKYGIETILPKFELIFNNYSDAIKNDPNYLYSNELSEIICKEFFNPNTFSDVPDMLNNRVDVFNLFKIYYSMKSIKNNNDALSAQTSDFKSNN